MFTARTLLNVTISRYSTYVFDSMITLRILLDVCGYGIISDYTPKLIDVPSARQHTLTIVNCPLFSPKRHSVGKLTIRDCGRNSV